LTIKELKKRIEELERTQKRILNRLKMLGASDSRIDYVYFIAAS
jgi:hypothetical protein